MAVTPLARQTLGETGIEITANNANTSGGGNSVPNHDGRTILFIHNNGLTGQATATVTAQKTSKTLPGQGTLTKANQVVTLDTGEMAMIGPFPQEFWNDSTGSIIVTAGGTGAADIDFGCFTLPDYHI